MSSEGDSGEKVFDPTPQKLLEARRRGDVPRSMDVSAALAYLALLIAIGAGGAYAVRTAGTPLVALIAQPDRLAHLFLGPGGPGLSATWIGDVMVGLSPIFLFPLLAVLIGLLAQRAVVFSGEKLMPKLSRLSMLVAAKNKFGPSGLVEFGKSTLKLVAIAIALFVYLSRELDKMIGAATMDAGEVPSLMMKTLYMLLAITTVISIVIASADVLWQRFNHARKLRMSLQDMRDEHKHLEGDPHAKSLRRQRGQEIAMNRMLLDVPKADVIIVNPTHYAVALKWSRARGSAPVCVAKGEDEIALRIREIAETARIPIHSDPPTARALNATVEIGQEIRPEHYKPVAAAVRFADRIRRASKERGV